MNLCSLSFQVCTTNASMLPVTEAGCLASRPLVNKETATLASSSPLKLTAPTKQPPSTRMFVTHPTSGHIWQSRTMVST